MWIIHVFMKKCSRKKNSQKFKMTVKIYGPPGSDSVAEKPYGPTGGPPQNCGLDPPLPAAISLRGSHSFFVCSLGLKIVVPKKVL